MNAEPNRPDAQHALHQAALAFRRGDKTQARRWASLAARLDPTSERPWLIMAGLASPRAAVAYLQRALEINPTSQSAQKGLDWAVRRLHEVEAAQAARPAQAAPQVSSTQPVRARRRRRSYPPAWAAAIFLVVFTGLCVAGLSGVWMALSGTGTVDRAFAMLANPSPTPTLPPPTSTPLPSPTYTLAPTATELPPTATDAPPAATSTAEPAAQEPDASPTPDGFEEAVWVEEPTVTPFLVDTLTPEPTPEPTFTPMPEPYLPDGVGSSERWIDVDLSDQMVYAYEGKKLVNSFLVSTGTWRTPTVKGQYKVYVKYRYADMSGPGYYLADVPYVMYFYKGYGLHGTYWHSNFGTPMSHGCVNLQTDNAGWLFDFASVGTVVNVHD